MIGFDPLSLLPGKENQLLAKPEFCFVLFFFLCFRKGYALSIYSLVAQATKYIKYIRARKTLSGSDFIHIATGFSIFKANQQLYLGISTRKMLV